jgi:hypothetical protein
MDMNDVVRPGRHGQRARAGWWRGLVALGMGAALLVWMAGGAPGAAQAHDMDTPAAQDTAAPPASEAMPGPQANVSDPDAFGYISRDNNGVGGAQFAWVDDVRGPGGVVLDLVANDSYRGGLPVGFAFPFYGYTYDRFWVSTNGLLGFGTPNYRSYSPNNDRLPSSIIRNPLIAAFWDDLNPSGDKRIAYRLYGAAPNRRLVVEWQTDRYYERHCVFVDRRYQCTDDNRLYPAFQVILQEDGGIVLQYSNPTGDAVDRGSATIGIQNENASIGQQVAFDEAVVRDGLAIQFDRPAGAPATAFVPPVPIATTTLEGCQDATTGGFRKLLQTNSDVRYKVGCPRRDESPLEAVQQAFEGGLMLWRGDTKQILATFSDQGRFAVFPDTYQDDPESELTPPEGRVAPVRGFGKLWRQNAGLQQRLGWALGPERGFHGAVQEFEHATLIWTGTEQYLIRVYFDDGSQLELQDPNRPE